MEITPVRVFSLTLFLFLAVMPGVIAGTGGYTVAPGVDGAMTGPPQDPVPISFWDLNTRQMLIALCLSFCPVLVYPVEIFFFLKMISVLGYRKIGKYAILYNENRQKIYETVMANPGVRLTALMHMTGMKEGTLTYHLRILRMKKRIATFGTGRYLRYFENNGRYSELAKKMFWHLQNPTARRILEILASSPEVSRKEIAGILGIAGPSITWHTNRMSSDGIITTQRNGRAVQYTLCPEGADIFRQFFGKEEGVTGVSPDANDDRKEL